MLSKLLTRQTIATIFTKNNQSIAQSVLIARGFSTTPQMNRIENVMVIGSGLMGSGIAQCCAASNKFNSVTLNDVSDQQLAKAKTRIAQSLTNLKEKKRVNIDNVDEVVSRITLSTQTKPVSEDNLLIIEAIPELIEPKQKIFKNLWQKGLHFFNPVPLMKLVEIVRVLDGTNDQTYEALVQFVKDIDHVSVTCKDTPGFIVNRLLVPYMQEAVRMLERGDATARDIDTAMKLGAGYPMGPFELMDYVGLDTNKFIVDAWCARGDPNLTIFKSKLIDSMVAKGNLGKKTGKGFYDYTKK